MEMENRKFYISVVGVLCLSMLLTLIPVWQLVIIPGILAGILNKSLKRGILCGFSGITLSWGIYVIVGVFSRNVYFLLDQFGELIFGGGGSGWIFLILIILLATIFGAMGGGIGNGFMTLINIYLEKHPYRDSKTKAE